MDFTLRYAGPKPLCSCKGIRFDTRKQDKFLYLSNLAELIQAIDHDYQISNPYIAQTGQKPLDANAIFDLIRKYVPDFDQYVEHWIAKTVEDIEDDIRRATCCAVLSQEERFSILNNIEMLRDYRIQRTINKSVYYAGIQALANIIHDQRLMYIITALEGKFFHVLHSVQGVLHTLRPPIDTSLEIYPERDRLMVALKIQKTR